MAIKNILNKMKSFVFKHKIYSAIIVLILLGAGFWSYTSLTSASGETRYVLASAENSTIISAVSGTGQVSALDEENISPKTSGDLTYIGIKNGQNVVAGQLVASIDPTDAQKLVDQAQINLNQAELDLKNAQGFTTSIGEKRGIKQVAQDNLNKSYSDGYNTVTSVFVSLPNIMTSFNDILFGTTLNKVSPNIDFYSNATAGHTALDKTAANSGYVSAKSSFDSNFDAYKLTNRSSSPAEIENLINKTYTTLEIVADAIKNSMNLIQAYQNGLSQYNIPYNTLSDTHLSTLNGYTNTLNNFISSLSSIKTSIETNTENLIQTDYDLTSSEQNVKDKQTVLDNAEKVLSYCYIRAPFDGTISTVNVQTGDTVSNGTSIATIVTKQRIAKISLNEVDAAKISVGQKVVATFDAIDGLSIAGKVAEVDTLGTVSQGVVSYNVKIIFDTQDARIKPGMSVSTNIITNTKQNVLAVPNSAVKSKNGAYYVLVPGSPVPTQKTVEIGIADDTNTEITSGLSEGDQVVTRTISGAKTTTTTTTNTNAARGATQSLFGAGGRPGN